MSISDVSTLRRGDKFTVIYLILFMVPALRVWAWWLFPKWNWDIIDLAMFLALAPTVLLSLLSNLIRWRWRRLVSLVLAVVMVVFVHRTLGAFDITPDSFRLAQTKDIYLKALQPSESELGKPRFKTFTWDETFTDKSYRTLVFDESDQIALPPGTQSASWLQQMERRCAKHTDCVRLTSDPPDEYISVRKVADHFYIVDDSFPNAFP